MAVHTPKHASWLNQVEIFFSIIQRKVLSPNDFEDLTAVEQRLLDFEDRYNATAAPFKALSVQSSHTFTAGSAVFDECNLVSAAGLVPVLELSEQAGLSELIDGHVDLASTRVPSGAVNPVGKLASIIGGMLTGADSIDDVDTIRAVGTPILFSSGGGRRGRSDTGAAPPQAAGCARR